MDQPSIAKTDSNPSRGDAQIEPTTFFNKRIVVIIPSYNEERFIGSVVLKLLRFPVTVIVVDDGSTDGTASVADAAGAVIVHLPCNQGKAAALNAGFQHARELNPDVIVIIDADGQHLPEELPRVVQPVLDGVADIAVGSRYLSIKNHVPAQRVFGHLLFKWLTSVASGEEITDTQSGYRSFSPRAFKLIDFRSPGFSVESEMQFLAHELDLRMVEVPISVQYTDPPKRSLIQQGWSVLNGVLKLTEQYHPLLFFGVTGFILFIAGITWGFWVLERFVITHHLATGYAMVCLLLIIVGLLMMSTGIILQSIRGELQDIHRDIHATTINNH